MIGAMVGADDAEVQQRTSALMEALDVEAGNDGGAWFEERRRRWIMGTPEEARATVQRYAEAGVERIMLQDFLPHDLPMIELLGRELVGRV
jgi:alkanesulfonate monooxygenase SsuD/methylene tetrahydromethanopterin reductase-like flavin-dependent oxidoreductase (luciferase family)